MVHTVCDNRSAAQDGKAAANGYPAGYPSGYPPGYHTRRRAHLRNAARFMRHKMRLVNLQVDQGTTRRMRRDVIRSLPIGRSEPVHNYH